MAGHALIMLRWGLLHIASAVSNSSGSEYETTAGGEAQKL